MNDFNKFLQSVLEPALGKEITTKLLTQSNINNHFKRAFTHKTFVHVNDDTGDYEVLEKLGDRILKASLQHWLYEILYPEVTVPEPYAELEKVLEAKDQLAELSEKLGFDRYIRVMETFVINKDVKEDVFEAFIAAISLAGDTVTEDFGIVLAKRWIFQVYNTYVRDKVDVKNLSGIKDYVSQVNELWLFNGWGNMEFLTTGDGKAIKEAGYTSFAAVDLRAPNKMNFPAKFRGKILGSGTASTIAEAKQEASKNALKTLGIEFVELKESEIVVRFEDLANARLKRDLSDTPKVYYALMAVINDTSNLYNKVQIRTAKIVDKFVAQLRVEIEGNWKNSSRFKHEDKKIAMVKAITAFLTRAKKAQSIRV